MARQREADLYRQLIFSQFSFMNRGISSVGAIYSHVKQHYGMLCDDLYLCSTNCRGGHDQPEWYHATRRALGSLKSKGGVVRHTKRKGYWEFL